MVITSVLRYGNLLKIKKAKVGFYLEYALAKAIYLLFCVSFDSESMGIDQDLVAC
jgi:hypothetical protein